MRDPKAIRKAIMTAKSVARLIDPNFGRVPLPDLGRFGADEPAQEHSPMIHEIYDEPMPQHFAAGGGVDDDNPYAQPDENGFYSHAAATAARLPQERGTPEQFRGMLLNKGVKPEELHWGEYDYAFGDKPQVTRDEVAKHLWSTMPPIEEVLLAGPDSKNRREDMEIRHRAELWRHQQEHGDSPEGKALRYEIRRRHRKELAEIPHGDPFHEEYTLPGGKNYREILLKHGDEGKFGGVSQHFGGEGDILASLRMKDREDTEGNKILHLDELQSDWGQQAHEHGKYSPKAFEEYLRDLEQRAAPLVAEEFGIPESTAQAKMPEWTRTGYLRHQHLADMLDEGDEYHDKWIENESSKNSAVAEAPYIGKTEGWLDLGLKRALLEAARQGHDKLAWTTGDIQADRYPGGSEEQQAKRRAGMIHFYDKMLPKALLKLAKMHDPEATITGSEIQHKSPSGFGFAKTSLPALEITPQMRESILKRGFRTFASGGEVYGDNSKIKVVGGHEGEQRLVPISPKNTNYRHVMEYVPIEWLLDRRGNEYRHGPERMEQLRREIEEEGLREPVLVSVGKNSRTAIVGEGNHRVLAAHQLGYTHIPVRARVGDASGNDVFPEGAHDEDIIPQPNKYFPSEAKPSRVMRSLGYEGQEELPERWWDEGYASGGEVDDDAPKKTIKAYKLFKTKKKHPGKLFPLFVNSDQPVEVGKWLKAEAGPQGKTEGRVKSSLGDLAYRPGWHSGDLPIATHIGGKSSRDLKAPDYRPEDQVWAEVEHPADVDWQSVANSRASRTKSGDIIPRTAHITDQVPHGGHYRYKTNPNMTGNWIISGDMKVNRILSDDEVKAINDEHGVADLPRRDGFAGGGGIDIDRFREHLKRIHSPLSEDPESVQKALKFAASYRAPVGMETGTGSLYKIKQSMPASAVTRTIGNIPGVKLKPKKQGSWEDFYDLAKDNEFVNVGGDLSGFGRLTQINGKDLAWPVDLHAGADYMREPNPGRVWANIQAHATGYRSKIEDANRRGKELYGILSPMGATAVNSSHNMFDTLMAQIPNADIDPDHLKEFDEAIKRGDHLADIKRAKPKLFAEYLKKLEKWPGLENAKEASDFARPEKGNINGGHRTKIVEFMDQSRWRDRGFPEVGVTRAAITNPDLMGVGGNKMGHRVIKLTADEPAGGKSIFKHSTYPVDTFGEYVMDVPLVQRHYAQPDVIESMIMKPTSKGQIVHPYSEDVRGRQTARKLFEEQKMVQPVTQRFLDSVMMGMENQEKYGFKKGGAVRKALMIAKSVKKK